jgi:hypothetical protein
MVKNGTQPVAQKHRPSGSLYPLDSDWPITCVDTNYLIANASPSPPIKRNRIGWSDRRARRRRSLLNERLNPPFEMTENVYDPV